MTFMKGSAVTTHTALPNPTENQMRKSRATNLNRKAKKTIKYASNTARHRGKKTTGWGSRTGCHMKLLKSLKESLSLGLTKNSSNGIGRLTHHQPHCCSLVYKVEKVGTTESGRHQGELRNKTQLLHLI